MKPEIYLRCPVCLLTDQQFIPNLCSKFLSFDLPFVLGGILKLKLWRFTVFPVLDPKANQLKGWVKKRFCSRSTFSSMLCLSSSYNSPLLFVGHLLLGSTRLACVDAVSKDDQFGSPLQIFILSMPLPELRCYRDKHILLAMNTFSSFTKENTPPELRNVQFGSHSYK